METKVIENNNNKNQSKTGGKGDGMKMAGMTVLGGIIGGTATAVGMDGETSDPVPTQEPVEPEPVEPEPVTPDPVVPDPVDPEPVTPEPVVPEPVDPEPVTPEPEVPEPVDPGLVTPEPVVPDPDPADTGEIVEPAVPVIEIDPNDTELPDLVEDVVSVDVVQDVNGDQMIVAQAHNSEVGDFYLVDADVDGDFDVIVDASGIPVIDLTGENDQLITMTDVEAKMNDGYIEPNVIDDTIAQNNGVDGNDFGDDVVIVDA